MKRHVFFDLDGTLTDSAPGILRCFEYAVQSVGGAVPPETDLYAFIGPPLHETFEALLPDPDPATLALAIEAYRDRFDRIGILENTVYPGIESMLQQLVERGHRLYVATSKRQDFAERVIGQFGLGDHFEAIFGSRPQHGILSKTEILALGLTTREVESSDAVMIGDRHHDMAAANDLGVRSIGVTWGYGALDELGSARAIARSPEELVDLVSGVGSDQFERAHGSWELVVELDGEDEQAVEGLRRALRFSRSDRSMLRAMLPGAVRRGARVDLLPMLEKLRERGLDAKIRRRVAATDRDESD
jgi:phosphoglycolate phosphatase